MWGQRPVEEVCLHVVALWTLCVNIQIAPKGQAWLFFPSQTTSIAQSCRDMMRVIEATFSYSQLFQSSISGGLSLVQQIHNLYNLKNTCDHESKWEWETQKHWGFLVMPILCFRKWTEVKCWTAALSNAVKCNIVVRVINSQTSYYQESVLIATFFLSEKPWHITVQILSALSHIKSTLSFKHETKSLPIQALWDNSRLHSNWQHI